MPVISRFFGILIIMYFREGFNEPPHFHIRYGEYRAKMNIKNFQLMKGHLPPRAFGIVSEWASMHQKELLDNWERVIKQKPLKKIKPLN